MKMKSLLLLLISVVRAQGAFHITQHVYNSAVHQPGSSLEMKCKTNRYWEYCTWRHSGYRGDGSATIRDCNLEWKRASNTVIKQDCHDAVTNRVSIIGDYSKHECGIRIENVNIQDAGKWVCEMEEYVLLGRKGSGRRDKYTFDIHVQATTVPTTTTTTTTTITTLTTTTTLTTAKTTTTTTTKSTTRTSPATTSFAEVETEYDYSLPVNNGLDDLVDDVIDDTDGEATEVDSLNTQETTDESDFEDALSTIGSILDGHHFSDLDLDVDEEVDADGTTSQPGHEVLDQSDNQRQILIEEMIEDESSGGSNVGIIVGSILVVAVFIASVSLGVVFLKRRMEFTDVVSMQKLKEDGRVTEGFLADDVMIVDISNINHKIENNI